MNKNKRQSGNAMVIILVTIALFAALIMTFTRSTEQGAGNMNAQQARMAAQELIAFFNQVDGAVQKLRTKGCSENDISFTNDADTGTFVAANHAAGAPGDFSCHVFKTEGGKVTFNMDWTRYQLLQAEIAPPAEQVQWGNIYFKTNSYGQDGVGTAANDIMAHLNFVKPEICAAFNQLQNPDSPQGSQPATAFPGRYSFCVSNTQIRQIWIAR